MILLFLFMILAANAGIAVWRYFEKRREQHGTGRIFLNILTALLSVIDTAVIVVIAALFFAFTAPHWYLRACIVAAGVLILLFLILVMTGKLTVKRGLLLGAFAAFTIAAFFGSVWYDLYLEKITVPEHFQYTAYAPYAKDGLTAELDEEPSLTFSAEELPKMDGATALYPVYAAFAQAVCPDLAGKELADILQSVGCHTTAFAYQDIVDGECDIIFVAGPSREQESYAKEKGVELVYTPIGREAFVFFVHPDNPVSGLTLEQIRGIYSGKITRWSDLGAGNLGTIRAFQREEGSGSQTALLRFVMRDTPVMPADKETVIDGMGGMIEQVSPYRNHKNAIGYSFRFYCTALMKDFQVKLLSIDGISPTVENIENGSYLLASEFYAVTRSDADDNTRKLLEWIRGPQGQKLVEKTGYTPLSAGYGSKSEAAGFRYVHDPRSNPGAMADIVENPDAVYGFSPDPESARLGSYAEYDWTNPVFVAQARKERIAYHESMDSMTDILYTMREEGASLEEMARAVSVERNRLRLAAYEGDPEGLANVKESNLRTYGHEDGPTPDELFEKYGSWETVLQKAFSPNMGMDACCGLYDECYPLYIELRLAVP